jgi:predicted alpha/beta-fold hydrolase
MTSPHPPSRSAKASLPPPSRSAKASLPPPSRSAKASLPQLYFRATPRLDAILARCPTLKSEYRPTAWAANRHLQVALLRFAAAASPPLAYHREDRLTLDDGGTASLEWLDAPTDGVPVVAVLPTICGDGQSVRGLVRRLASGLGWHVVVLNRRGHGTLPLTSPRFNTMGSTADLRVQLDAVRRRHPSAPLYVVGMSAGSGLLVRWLGEEGAHAPAAAGVAYCPGYDIERAFRRVHPVYDRYLTHVVKRYFLERHAAVLAGQPGWEALQASRTLGDFHDRLHPFAGYPTPAAYYAASNPMPVASGIRRPLLTLNAEDDPVCVHQNVLDHVPLVEALPDAVIAVTRRGAHCAFYDGLWRPRSFAERVIVEWLAAVEATRTA